MAELTILDQLQRDGHTMELFLDKFPILKSYIINAESCSEQMVRVKNIIVNIRHILGWPCCNKPAIKITDIKQSETMHELAILDCKSLLEVILNYMVHILWLITEDAACSPSFIDGEEISIDISHLKEKIYKYARP